MLPRPRPLMLMKACCRPLLAIVIVLSVGCGRFLVAGSNVAAVHAAISPNPDDLLGCIRQSLSKEPIDCPPELHAEYLTAINYIQNGILQPDMKILLGKGTVQFKVNPEEDYPRKLRDHLLTVSVPVNGATQGECSWYFHFFYVAFRLTIVVARNDILQCVLKNRTFAETFSCVQLQRLFAHPGFSDYEAKIEEVFGIKTGTLKHVAILSAHNVRPPRHFAIISGANDGSMNVELFDELTLHSVHFGLDAGKDGRGFHSLAKLMFGHRRESSERDEDC